MADTSLFARKTNHWIHDVDARYQHKYAWSLSSDNDGHNSIASTNDEDDETDDGIIRSHQLYYKHEFIRIILLLLLNL